MKGIGRQVKNVVTSRNSFLPQISDRAPMRGAERKLRNPLTPMIIPLYRRALLWKVVLRMLIMGAVINPQAKNCRNTATTACHTEAFLHWHPDIFTIFPVNPVKGDVSDSELNARGLIWPPSGFQ